MPPLAISKASDLEYGKGFYYKALLIGPSGSGKTTGAASFPGRKLFIDCDQGREVLLGRADVDVISIDEPDPLQPRAWMEMKKVKDELKMMFQKGAFPYDCVILDSITRAYELAMGYVMLVDSQRNAGGTPVSTHWMAQKRECGDLLEMFLNSPVHFISTVHELPDKDELTGAITYQPAITGKDSERITRRFREIYHCFGKGERGKDGVEKTQFFWRTMPEPQRPYLKSSLNTGQKFWGAVVPPSVEGLFKLRGIKLAPSQQPLPLAP